MPRLPEIRRRLPGLARDAPAGGRQARVDLTRVKSTRKQKRRREMQQGQQATINRTRLTSLPEHLGLAFVPVFGLPEAAGQRAVVEAFPAGDGRGTPEDPKANVQWTFAGSDCRRAQARRQGVLHGPDAGKSARACLGWRGNAPAGGRQARVDLTRVKSTRKQMRRHEMQQGQADVTP